MPKCKKCNKHFHAGLYADLPHNWEYEYCSGACWKNSEEYELAVEGWKDVFSYLEDSELKTLYYLMDDEDSLEVGFELLIKNVI